MSCMCRQNHYPGQLDGQKQKLKDDPREDLFAHCLKQVESGTLRQQLAAAHQSAMHDLQIEHDTLLKQQQEQHHTAMLQLQKQLHHHHQNLEVQHNAAVQGLEQELADEKELTALVTSNSQSALLGTMNMLEEEFMEVKAALEDELEPLHKQFAATLSTVMPLKQKLKDAEQQCETLKRQAQEQCQEDERRGRLMRQYKHTDAGRSKSAREKDKEFAKGQQDTQPDLKEVQQSLSSIQDNLDQVP